jgi:hypothetical protein
MCANNLMKSTYFMRYCDELAMLNKDSPIIFPSFAMALSYAVVYLGYGKQDTCPGWHLKGTPLRGLSAKCSHKGTS